MSVGSMLARSPVSASPDDSLATVACLMEKENVGAVVIVAGRRPVGIVTDRDLAMAVCADRHSPDEHVNKVMTCPVETLAWDEGLFNATQRMMDLGVRRLPVVNRDTELIGVLSLDDLLLLLSRELNNMAEGIQTGAVAK